MLQQVTNNYNPKCAMRDQENDHRGRYAEPLTLLKLDDHDVVLEFQLSTSPYPLYPIAF